MRRVLILGILAFAVPAIADKRIVDMTPGYEREAGTCLIQGNGIAKVTSGATVLAPTLTGAEREEIERDVEQLAKGLALVKQYCEEVNGLLSFLKDNAAASYKSVEKELDARDNKVRKLRKDAKKTIEELQPITRKLIPRITRTPTAAPPTDDKRTPAAFPSRRAIDLPALPGSWRLSGSTVTDTAEYTDKGGIAATVTARPFPNGTCDQQRKALAAKTDALGEVEVVGAKDLGIAWSVRYVRRDKKALVGVMCLATTKTGSVLATAESTPATQTALADELAKLMVRMLAAQSPEPKKNPS